MHVSSVNVSHYARAIERSQSDRISNVFVSQPRLALHRMYTGTPWHAIERSFGFNRSTDGPGDPRVHSVQGKARQADENIRNSIALGPFDGPSIVRNVNWRDMHQKVANCCISNVADEEIKYRKVFFDDWGIFWNAALPIWSMDAGLRARTKQFIEFSLKISFTPCFYL